MNEVLDALEALGSTFWLTEGTLIGLLRHGRNDSAATGRVVDHDVDVMIEMDGQEDWESIARTVRRFLEERGWSRATLGSTSRATGARADRLRIWRRGRGFARTKCDIHSYVADRGREIALSHGDADSYPFQRWGGFLPLALVELLRRCRCYERTAPVSKRPPGDPSRLERRRVRPPVPGDPTEDGGASRRDLACTGRC